MRRECGSGDGATPHKQSNGVVNEPPVFSGERSRSRQEEEPGLHLQDTVHSSWSIKWFRREATNGRAAGSRRRTLRGLWLNLPCIAKVPLGVLSSPADTPDRPDGTPRLILFFRSLLALQPTCFFLPMHRSIPCRADTSSCSGLFGRGRRAGWLLSSTETADQISSKARS